MKERTIGTFLIKYC